MRPVEASRRRRLTPKQRAVVEFVTKNPDATLDEIGRACGLSPAYPAGGAQGVLRSENVQRRMAELMDQMPALQDQALLVRLQEGLAAKRKDRLISQRTGEITEFDDDDMPTRRQYLDLAVKLKGALKNQHEVSGPNGGPVPLTPSAPIVALASLTKEQLEAIAKGTGA